ncbi:MAG TPA: hypothetical protein DCZ49_02255 [Hyphomonadaceae bacterium]|nr:hypothetical protein [Hyphomonadaceae bacterium]
MAATAVNQRVTIGNLTRFALPTLLLLAAAACETTTPGTGGAFPASRSQGPDGAAPPTRPINGEDQSPAEGDGDSDRSGDIGGAQRVVDDFALSRPGLTPAHMQGRPIVRLALLLPFSHNAAAVRAETQSMLAAAELALFRHGDLNIALLPKDTRGTADGAQAATDEALRDGADIILGPLLSENVRATVARAQPNGKPVIGFSTDATAVNGAGAYLLSTLPSLEVANIVRYAAAQGITHFHLIGPDTEFGRRVREAFANEVALAGARLGAVETYPARDQNGMSDPARRLAQSVRQIRAAERGRHAVLLPEQGEMLQALAPLLPFHGLDPRDVQFLGLSLWNDAAILREPALANGWFTLADPDATAQFRADYVAAYEGTPSSLAPLAYDAVAMAARLAAGGSTDGLSVNRLESVIGFAGAEGLFRLLPNGRTERVQAIMQVMPEGAVVLAPAAKRFPESGS